MNRPQQITGNQTPVVEKRQSSSGMFTVTDMDHHNPSVNSDNSTGSTSNGWVVKDARPSSRCSETNSVESSSSCPPQFKSTLQRSSSIVSKASSNGSESKKSLSPSSSNRIDDVKLRDSQNDHGNRRWSFCQDVVERDTPKESQRRSRVDGPTTIWMITTRISTAEGPRRFASTRTEASGSRTAPAAATTRFKTPRIGTVEVKADP